MIQGGTLISNLSFRGEIMVISSHDTIRENQEKQKPPKDWSERIGEKFHLRGEDENFQMYTVKGFDLADKSRVVFERDDSWTFTAVNPVISPDNTIEWDYSTDGHFADEQRLQEHLDNAKEAKHETPETPKLSKPRKGTLKQFIDTEIGEHDNICIYNRYKDFLCEGKPSELRQNGLWRLLDEENANIKMSYSGISENGNKAINIVLSNIPLKDRRQEKPNKITDKIKAKQQANKAKPKSDKTQSKAKKNEAEL